MANNWSDASQEQTGGIVEDFLKDVNALKNGMADTVSTVLGALDAMTQAAKQAKNSAAKLKRTLLGFDQINKVRRTATGKQTPVWPLESPQKTESASLLVNFLNGVKDAAGSLTKEVFSGLDYAWKDILQPMGQWTPNGTLTGELNLVSLAMGDVNRVIGGMRSSMDWLWSSFLGPAQSWDGAPLIDGVKDLGGQLLALCGTVAALPGPLQSVTGEVGLLGSAWDRIAPGARLAVEAVRAAWGGMGTWLRGQVVTPMSSDMKGMLNGIIGCFNGTLSGAQKAVNAVVGALNSLSFTLPDWIPLLGGKRFSMNLKTVSMPPIPYLAQGAVLPANRPFLALVGDQKHGTNIEAPLSTIQEAVALVMEEQTSAILAGFSASTQIQREILEAVLGISIGDEVIARAVDRSHAKLAVVTGGSL